jgi:hypothetical protein
MIRKLVALLFCVCNTFVFSQVENKNEFSIYNYKPTPQDRLILEVNHTGWLGMPDGLKEKLTSGGVNIILFFDHPIKQSRYSFAWGIGLSSHNIHGPINLNQDIDPVTRGINFLSVSKRVEPYKKNRIGFKIIELPVEFRIRTKTNYQFKLMAGFKVGYVLQTFKKTFDQYGKIKIFDIYGVNPIRYGPTIRIGWEQVHITAFYSLSEVFLKNKGQAGIIPFSIGFAYTPRVGIGR